MRSMYQATVGNSWHRIILPPFVRVLLGLSYPKQAGHTSNKSRALECEVSFACAAFDHQFGANAIAGPEQCGMNPLPSQLLGLRFVHFLFRGNLFAGMLHE